MQNKPLVSIVTITRNLIKEGRKDFFRQCVDSVKIQDYPHIEHIIVDGASDDGTLDLFNELGLEYVSEPDSGIYNAFNKGVKRANGKYVAFLNSDDYYTIPNAVTLVVEALEKSNADFTYAPVQNIHERTGRIYTKQPVWEHCFRAIPFCHQTMFTKKDVILELGGFDESYRITADFDLIMRALLAKKRPIAVDEPFVAFRLGGLSSAQCEKCEAESIRVIATHCQLSLKRATKAHKNLWLPEKHLKKLLAQTVDFPNPQKCLTWNRKRFCSNLRHCLFTLRMRKGRRLIRLLGITFYKENPLQNKADF